MKEVYVTERNFRVITDQGDEIMTDCLLIGHNDGDFLSPAILCLGSFLHSKGLNFDYVNSFDFEKEALKEKLLQKNLLAVGITTTFYVSVKPIAEIIAFIRKYNQTENHYWRPICSHTAASGRSGDDSIPV